MSLPIRVRLTIWYVLLLTVILVALGGFLTVRLSADLVQGVDRSLDSRAAQISLGFKGQGEGEFQDISDASLSGLPRGESAAQLLSAEGTVLETSGDQVAATAIVDRVTQANVLSGARVRQTLQLGADREPFRVLAVAIRTNTGTDVMVVATSLEDIEASIHRLLALLFIAGPIALAVAGVGGRALARKALRPVSLMTKKAAEIGSDRLHERVEVPPGSDELTRLAETLNGMLARLQRGAEDQRRFIADASHELRTPLGIMASELDVDLRSPGLSAASRETLESAREEVDRMASIVEDLLILARLDEGRLVLDRQSVELGDLVRQVVQDLEPLASRRVVEVQVRGVDRVAQADRARLGQAVRNVIENALKHSDDGDQVVVELWGRAGEVGLTVQDAGPGIPEEVLPRVFDRFFRADTARSRALGGSGLGLSIAREIVRSHGGRIWVESTPGKGCSFSIALPPTTRASVDGELALPLR